ncbi:hypothetical protein AVEN_150910-1 [Araneus ventricosus]|uniref:Uncharacterized protein n=1 Tax=Araneus ventricosus TaxID=182803 RepID=A0A4Y2C8R7_ARAVE|nr:hypothetical protein AVEN_150910-1 [Araneus ventricosus]
MSTFPSIDPNQTDDENALLAFHYSKPFPKLDIFYTNLIIRHEFSVRGRPAIKKAKLLPRLVFSYLYAVYRGRKTVKPFSNDQCSMPELMSSCPQEKGSIVSAVT